MAVLRQEHPAGGIDTVLLRRWIAQLRRWRPDLVHVRGMGNEGFHGALAAAIARCPRVLVSVHGSVRELSARGSVRYRLIGSFLEPATIRLATHVVTVCRSATDTALVRGAGGRLVGVVPNGVDPAEPDPRARARLRARLGISAAEVVLVAVGRLSLEKGHLVLADALDRLAAAGHRPTVLVIGEGPDRTVIQQRYRDVKGSPVHLMGHRENVFPYLAAADVFVFPTLHENLSNALIEAMASGLPVIATSVGGNVEVLQGGGGRLVPAGEAPALAEAIAHLISGGPELRASVGAAARKNAVQNYSVARMVSGWESVYRRILATG